MTNHEKGYIPDSLAEQVYWDNVRDNQIGGVSDGISREVAEDIGYKPPHSFEEPVLPEDDVHGENPVEIDNVIDIGVLPRNKEDSEEIKSAKIRHPSRSRIVELPGKHGRTNWREDSRRPTDEHIEMYHMHKDEIAELRAKLRGIQKPEDMEE